MRLSIKSPLQKLLLGFSSLLLLLFPSPLSALDEGFYSANDILFYREDDSCTPTNVTSSIASDGGAQGDITIAQANIKQHHEDIKFITDNNPDFVTLNETGRRSVSQLEVSGYKAYRDNSFFKSERATNQAKSTAILWKTDRWSKVDTGREIIVPVYGPQEWDMGRAITWGVFRDNDGGTASVISLHHMINPNKYAGSPPNKPLRKQLYSEGMDRVASKVQELSALGPVIIGGDFNFQISDNENHGPRKKLAKVNMESTNDSLGRLRGTAIDYIFYTKNMTAKRHWAEPVGQGNNNSDHPYIYATLTADGSGGGTAEVKSENGCVCQGSSPSSILSGGDNEEKAFRFFTGKGLSSQQSAGIVGNMKAESGVQPMRLQNTASEVKTSSKDIKLDGLGWGLVQWTPPSKMVNPSIAAGKTYSDIDSLAFQLEFLWGQLTGTGVGNSAGEKAAGDHLKQQTTIDGSARSFMLKFERPRDQSENAQKHRSQLANEVFGKFNGGNSSTSPSTPGAFAADCNDGNGGGDVVSIAQAELAKEVVEIPSNCDTINGASAGVRGSCGPEIDKYTDGWREYWCADFVSWVYKEAGTPFTGGLSGGWRIPAVRNIEAWFRENATYIKNDAGVRPQPGDVYFMGISHTGIIEKVEGNTIYTISGNTSVDNTGNGKGVGRGSYTIGDSAIYGYGRL